MRRELLIVVVLAVWLGAALLAVAVVAPAAFDVLPTRTLAGALVGRVLPAVMWGGVVAGLVALASGRASKVAMWSAATAAIACGVAQLVVDPRIDAIRRAVAQPMDTLPSYDPRRAAFGWLHAASVGLLGVAMIAAATSLVALLLTQRGQAPGLEQPEPAG